MEIILIVVIVVLLVYMFWPKNKKPGTPITKSRTTPETANPEVSDEEMASDAEIPSEYVAAKANVKDTGSFFYRKKVCISGKLRGYTTRELAKSLWEKGAVIHTSVDDACEVLICGDGASPMECKKAEQRGVRVMYENDLAAELKRA